jgi:glycosyltransferase involved in cell wall biosynthesis
VRVALVHDWLTGMRGGERVLEEHARFFPDADLYTLVHVPGSTSAAIESLRIHASPLSRLPGVARHYRKLLPLFPWAVSRLRPQDVDLVLSTSHAVAKGVRPPPRAVHVSYCFTPMRYVWDQSDAYLGRGALRVASWPLAASLRAWDRRTSTPERVHRFLAISAVVAQRIARAYGRSAPVIHPPVRTDAFHVGTPEDFYLLVGGFVPYKREELALAAFAELGLPLVVAGDGPTRASLEAKAPPNARFVGRVSDAALADLYARCRALVYPQEEDFGIVAVEAQAAGRPVVAFAGGGALETVVPLGARGGAGPTGIWFAEPTRESLVAAVRALEAGAGELDPAAIRRHAERFSVARYRSELFAALAEALHAGRRATG